MQVLIVVTVEALCSATVIADGEAGSDECFWRCALIGQSVLVSFPSWFRSRSSYV